MPHLHLPGVIMSNRTERQRQVVSGSIAEQELKQRAEQGWRMVAVEWEREVAADQPTAEEVPFGLQLSPENARLETNPSEWQALILMMEMTVQEGPYWSIAEELNRRGFHTRNGDPWTPISVFQMLPRLIEIGPRIFATDEWQKRREHLRHTGNLNPSQQ
jgi:Recombinase